ncbi:MAG: hypothetical protein HY721_01065 [Planctomycetes bacterium]|nr:hypothetical protein [Planctomycetota bacterium]
MVLVVSTAGQLGEGYLYELKTAADFEKLSKPSLLPGVDRSTKFLVPIRDGDPDLLPVVFQNVNVYPFHSEFMAAEFPEKFPGLTGDDYLALAERRATRKYFAGLLFRFNGEPATFGFDLFTGDSPDELPRPDEARWVYDHVAAKLPIGPLAYTPVSPQAIRNAEGWPAPGFPVSFAFGGGSATYIPYVLGTTYGRVRILDPAEFQLASDRGEISLLNILVLHETPSDIEGVVAGLVTGSFQDEGSHVFIRMARRGTPNAFVKDAPSAFGPHEGKVVRLTIEAARYTIADATLEEAEAWWATHKPAPVVVPEIDRAYDKLDAAWEIPLDGSMVLNGRYGGKGANFGRLWNLVSGDHRDKGFAIPMRYYFQYVETQRVDSHALPGVRVSLARYIEELLQDPDFRGDSRTRFVELEKLRELFEDGTVDPQVVSKIDQRIVEVFGSAEGKVRFRSSSNAEHILEFNGAGLYESSSACAADDLDVGTGGPSRCDLQEPRERGVARALKRVWGSLWSYRGFEEREYYSIPHAAVGMGILVSESFGDDELANAVAFTGNPAKIGDPTYLVNCQAGDVEVVKPPPGVESEQDLLDVDAEGNVTRIRRVRRSNQVPAGQVVLSDDQLKEVGKVMHDLHVGFPFDLKGYPPERVLRDIEFKVDAESKIRFKDIRLFVIPETGQPPAPELRVVVPEGMTLCSTFWERRPARYVLDKKLVVGLKAGVHAVKAGAPMEVFEWIQFEPSGQRLGPIGPATWQKGFPAQRAIGPPENRVVVPGYDFAFAQKFKDGDELVEITFDTFFLQADGPEEALLDGAAFTWPLNDYYLVGVVDFGEDPGVATYLRLLPCDISHLPRHSTDVEFTGGDKAYFEERFQDLDEGTGPADLKLAEVTLAGETRVVADYWRLAYTAGHHNDTPYPEFWAVFDPAWDVPGTGTVHAIQLVQGNRQDSPPAPPRAFLLGEGFAELRELGIASLVRRKEGVNQLLFRRGDYDFSGDVSITDAILILRWLFAGGGVPVCEDAADVDDLGSVEITDAILVLDWLFLGGEEPLRPGPFECGGDDLPDELPECKGPGCQ